MVVNSSVIIYFAFGGAGVAGWFVLRCGGPFGGWCRRQLIVDLVECAYVPLGVLVRLVGRGLFAVGGVVGVCASRGALRDVGRVLYGGIYVGMRTACIVFVYLHMSRQSLILVAARVGGRGVSGVCRLGCGGGGEMLVWCGEWFL